jgi:2-polyprenyl-6-methoxyphenol hydroxylase-like FAD-dependent oxidoreductase
VGRHAETVRLEAGQVDGEAADTAATLATLERRIALAGDAAHAMAPNLGQGANSALVDAAILADELAADRPVPHALARYGARRRRPARRVQRSADLFARLAEITISIPALRARREDVLLLLAAVLSVRRGARLP